MVSVSLLAGCSLAYATQQPLERVKVTPWLINYVLPSYEHLHQANLTLQESTAGLCASETLNIKAIQNAQPALINALNAMAYSQGIDGGPMQGQLRNFRIYFWPDRKNLVEKQLSKLLKEPDYGLLEPMGLTHASVALTGYPVIERLLFDPYFQHQLINDKEGFTCQYLNAVTQNISHISQQVVYAWQNDWRLQLAHPKTTNTYIKTDQHQVNFIFTNVDVLLAKIISKKLTKPLTSSAKTAKPKRMESWRSQQSINMLKTNMTALTDILTLVLKPSLQQSNNMKYWLEIEQKLSFIQFQLNQLPSPLTQYLNTPKVWDQVSVIKMHTQMLQAQLQQLHPALGVQLGFNAYDGD